MPKGKCKHGEFELMEGCPQCIEERRKQINPDQPAPEPGMNLGGNTLSGEFVLHLIKVQYYSSTSGELSSREYTYFSEERVSIGDIMTVPVRDTTGKARVRAIDVPDSEIAAFRDKVKVIPSGSILGHAEDGEENEVTVAEETIRPEQEEMEAGLNFEGLTLIDYSHPAFSPDPNAWRTGEEEIRTVSPEEEVPMGGLAKAVQEAGAKVTVVNVPETAIALRPGEDIEVRSYYEEAQKLLEYANARKIDGAIAMKDASADLAIISRVKKQMEAKKKEKLEPSKIEAEAIRDTYNYLMNPILEAEKITKGKMLDFNANLDRIRREQGEINRKRMEAAEQEMKLTGELSQSVDLVEESAPAQKLVRTDLGTSSQRDNWQFEVVDIDAIPRPYMMPDMVMLGAIAKKYHDQKPVPGVRFFNKPIIATRTG